MTSRWRHGLSGGRIEWSYAWDGEDRLVRTTGPGDRVWTYTYDGLGRRVGRTRAVAGVVDESRSYVWSGNLLIEQVTRVYEREPVLAGVSAAGVGGGGTDGCVAVVTWDHDPRTGVPLVQRGTPHGGGAGGPGVGPGPVGGSAGWSQDRVDDEFFAIVADLAGAPTELLTPDGDIAWRREASVWGVPGRSGPQGCPLGSLGQVYDEDTGWVYNLHRYYDPVLGGLTAPDPIGIEGGVNPHAGVPNPLTWTDPLGLAGCEAVGKAAEALAGRPAAKTGTVWDDVVGTAGAIPGTGGLPKSFELTAGNSRVWVHGNVTDHLADAARSAARSGQSLEMVGLGTQQRLRSLQAAVGGATRGGVPLNQRMTVGGWELEFRQRAGDALPALIHGRWVG
nr:RHS repeat-associated core domain-containing protein [Austwickia sp. TVS 96-490-7B]